MHFPFFQKNTVRYVIVFGALGLAVCGVFLFATSNSEGLPRYGHLKDYVLDFDSFETMQQKGTTSAVAAASFIPLYKEFVVFTPDDEGDARVRITDKKTGVSCDSPNLLISGLTLSDDQKILYVTHYSGSNIYNTTIDTTNCQEMQ